MKTTPYDSEKTRRFRKAIARFERELAPNPAGAPERPSSVANRRRNGRSTRNTPGWYDRYKKSGKSRRRYARGG